MKDNNSGKEDEKRADRNKNENKVQPFSDYLVAVLIPDLRRFVIFCAVLKSKTVVLLIPSMNNIYMWKIRPLF